MQRLIKWIIGLSLLFGLSALGNWIVAVLALKVPGSVIGMVLLLLLLMTKIIRVEWIEDSAGFLTKHLAFFFIPIAVGLMSYSSLLKAEGVPLFLALIISMTIGLVVTALVSGKHGEAS
ncbi:MULTISPECIES: CidA/LrgA family protein [Exiguobacterium]|uniref:CidA/LrgA family protein n=1 Tax=Exiguobacterium TaxID=33986 RepID=UPI00087758A7|nr:MULTISPECIES: CidA/LrgA family protein [Exiguobacterium]TCI34513.1 CidA/LrgA family protein [Exiguobacterium sp. SH4S7]TCI60587.1 CidA/LrgA family protein [Exiguobacterium sp. SH0S2]TCI67577.1 CidA/LrgA family protein [Exiguobacterium sp. SH0S7]